MNHTKEIERYKNTIVMLDVSFNKTFWCVYVRKYIVILGNTHY